jgi:hypothetical protein
MSPMTPQEVIERIRQATAGDSWTDNRVLISPIWGLLICFLLPIGIGVGQQTTPDVKGTWSGTFISKNAEISPFTMTVKINSDSRGHLIGDASLVSDCLDSHRLQVTVNAPNIVLAGSDSNGDTATFSGTLDNTATLMTLSYVINGSPSGRCEIDNGTGTMSKR